MKWNMWKAMLTSSIIMMCAMIYLLWSLAFNDYFDVGHMLLIFGWMPLWVTLSLLKKEQLKNINL